MSQTDIKLSLGKAEEAILLPLWLVLLLLAGTCVLLVLLVSNAKCAVCSVFFIAPESYEELKSLLSGKSVEEQFLVVERIQKCNHPSLAVGNKAKLEVRRRKGRWRVGGRGWAHRGLPGPAGHPAHVTLTHVLWAVMPGSWSRQRSKP